MSDGDRDSGGDERSGRETHITIPDEALLQVPLSESYMDDTVRDLTLSMAQHVRLPQGQSSQPQMSAQVSRRIALLGEFHKLNPPNYRGNEGPEDAEEWVEELEQIFEAMDCTDADRVALAEFSLKMEARRWWKATKRALGDTPEVSWEDFKRIFMDKFFPFTVRERKAKEFEELIQGTMTVFEYEGRFAVLSKYALYMVQDPAERARRFERGLNLQIRRSLAPMRLKDYNEIYHRAQLIERTLTEIGEYPTPQAFTSSSSSGKRPLRGSQVNQGPSKRSNTSGSGSRRSSSGHSDGSSMAPLCSRCGSQHWGDTCVRGTPRCFRCRQPGHLRRNCPLKRQQITTGQSHSQAGPPLLGPSRLGPPRLEALTRARGLGSP